MNYKRNKKDQFKSEQTSRLMILLTNASILSDFVYGSGEYSELHGTEYAEVMTEAIGEIVREIDLRIPNRSWR